MQDHPTSRHQYVCKVLTAYRQTPGTTGIIRRQDRLLAAQLYQRAVPLIAVQNALVLAAARRLLRDPASAPLPTVRSLAYFLPALDEVLHGRINQNYFQYLRQKIKPFVPIPQLR